jgi:Tat protein secretion system quality control protein TatD with DNase activity
MHCFSGSLKLADAALQLGFLISFAGVLISRRQMIYERWRTGAARSAVNETDCPYLRQSHFGQEE